MDSFTKGKEISTKLYNNLTKQIQCNEIQPLYCIVLLIKFPDFTIYSYITYKLPNRMYLTSLERRQEWENIIST